MHLPGWTGSGKSLKLDTREALLRLGGNQELYDRLLVLTCSNHANTAKDIRAAIQANDIALANRLAHTLKGVAGTLGATDLQEASRRLELVLASRLDAQYTDLLKALEVELKDVLG